MLRFLNTKIEGFASIQYMEFNWSSQDRGIVIISASNGSGKSKLINSLFWALYGKTMSGAVEMWVSIRPKDYKGVKVELEFEKDGKQYKVIRCQGYTGKVEGRTGKNGLFFYQGGNLDTGRDKRGIQERIDKILGYSPELFLNSVVFGQKQARLMDDKSANKKRFFEEAFEVGIFQDAYAKAKAKFEKVSQEVTNLKIDIDVKNKSIKAMEEKIEMANRLEVRWIDEHVKRIGFLENALEEAKEELIEWSENKDNSLSGLKDDIKTLKRQRKELGDVFTKYHEANSNVIRLESDIKLDDKSISNCDKMIEANEENIANLPTSCPECGRPYNKEDLRKSVDIYKQKIGGFTRDKRAYTLAKKQHERSLLDAKEKLSSLKEQLNQVNSLDSKIESLENALQKEEDNTQMGEILTKKVKRAKKNLKECKEERYVPDEGLNIEEIRNCIGKTEKFINNLKKELIKRRVEKNRYQFAMESFSNKGIKPWLFNILLEQVNERLENYEQLSGFKVVFWVDMGSANGDIRVLVNRFGIEVPYEDLSGGQQQLINLTTIFAINEVIQETKPCGLFIGDELFESLDKTNVEVVANILQDRAEKQSIFLVTHLLDFNIQNSEVIKLENVNGITTLLS